MALRSKILQQILTSYDNKTFDTGRVLAFLYFISTIVFQAWTVFHGGPFDPQSYLVGGGGFLAGLGVYLFGDKESPKDKMVKSDAPPS
jgi:hypothetical protein